MKRFEFVKGGCETGPCDGDCMARALEIVTEGFIPYEKAREFCLASIRDIRMDDFMQTRNREGNGANFGDFLNMLRAKDFAEKGSLELGTPVTSLFLQRMAHLGFAEHRHFDDSKLWTLADLPQTGRWLVTIQDHASTFIDGRVVDLEDWQGRRVYRDNGLYEAWEWKP